MSTPHPRRDDPAILRMARVAGLALTTSILYLIVGVTLGPLGVGLLIVNPIEHSRLLELAAEVAVLISLFVAGLKLRSALTDRR